MKIFNFFFLILTVLCSLSAIAKSKENLAYINLDNVIENSIYGKKVLSEIKLLNDENIKKLKNMEKEIKFDENELNKKKIYYLKMNLIMKLRDLRKSCLNLEKLRMK